MHQQSETNQQSPPVIVMGVSGVGKTTVGRMLADALGAEFFDGDDLHPPKNREKMRQGRPLTDNDRFGWLQAVGSLTRRNLEKGQVSVVACSALKNSYRRLLLREVPSAVFLHLAGDRELIRERIGLRRHEFMSTDLLDSQYNDLEPPGPDEPHFVFDVTFPPEVIVELTIGRLRKLSL